ncbi:MAG: hypothetical protein LIP77_06005 [Planctomycetes bacterium]|nr:hypothetical protein [Planctomycetota bacterium]
MAKTGKKPSDKRKLCGYFDDALAGDRTATPCCRHFGDCGGCEFQDVPYPRQLDAKRGAFAFIADEVIRELREPEPEGAAGAVPCDRTDRSDRADRLAAMLAAAPVGVVPSPRNLGYRQRMDYVYAFGRAGLRRANRHRQVVDLEECPLLGESGFRVVQKAKRLAADAGLKSYDYLRHVGELRYFVLRQTRRGDVLLSLVTKTREPAEAVTRILGQLLADGDIVSGHWLLADGLGDVSFGIPLAAVGERWIVETMNGIDLCIGPNTFFQSNPAVAEQAYAAIRDFVPPNARVLDMYSGVGAIALTVAGTAAVVEAVENVPENVELAWENITRNRIAAVRLLRHDAARYLRELADNAAARRPELVVVNPPRPGVEGDGMAAIRRLGPARLAYLSCNPFTLLRNLSEIADDYALHSLAIYDMFPQTRHFETLALLEKIR